LYEEDTKKNDGQKLNSMMDISPKMTEPYMLGKPTNKKKSNAQAS
jgi:hypothetical protein